MEFDQRAAEEKLSEMREAAKHARSEIGALPADVIDATLRAFSRVTPPEAPELVIQFITISSLSSSPRAQSRKPGNVLLNWQKLIDIVPDISLAGLGATALPVSPPWAAILAGLYIWNKIRRGITEEFTDVEALVILALWKHRDGRNKIPEEDGFTRTNELRASYSLPPLTLKQFTFAIDRLIAIRCLQVDDGIIWLREWTRVKYS
jgi:hypothetical protein